MDSDNTKPLYRADEKVRKMVKELIEDPELVEMIKNDLKDREKMTPRDRANTWIKLMEYAMPKFGSMQVQLVIDTDTEQGEIEVKQWLVNAVKDMFDESGIKVKPN